MFNATKRRGRQIKDTMIGVDLAKNVFQLHCATKAGHLKFRKKLTRSRFQEFMSNQPSCLVVMEACGSASYWAREMVKLGLQSRNLSSPSSHRTAVSHGRGLLTGWRKSRFRGLDRTEHGFHLALAAYNLTRMPKLIAAEASSSEPRPRSRTRPA